MWPPHSQWSQVVRSLVLHRQLAMYELVIHTKVLRNCVQRLDTASDPVSITLAVKVSSESSDVIDDVFFLRPSTTIVQAFATLLLGIFRVASAS
jgi:hypothetical protein